MYIKLSRIKKGFLTRRIECESNMQIPSGLEFNLEPGGRIFDRKKLKLTISRKGAIVVQTDGYSYIEYPVMNKKFIKHFHDLKDLAVLILSYTPFGRGLEKKPTSWMLNSLHCNEDEIVFNTGIRKDLRAVKDIDGDVFMTGGGACRLYARAGSDRYNLIESDEDIDFIFALGVLAYCWTEDEYYSYITA